ncbi:MAG: hypothetical protein OXC95_05350, partial [Dehalococcoidia bacterium]|nr:hypothetical protein [Dehalococcoidia bacterium]
MLNITGNIVSTTVHEDRVTGRIAAGARGSEPFYISFTSFGAFAKNAMSTLKKGHHATLSGMLITLPERQTTRNRAPERNTILKVES